ncbi:aarF domain-containing protein kinase 1-like [Amphibalanus amphitrite]|uniref:aarF domain-containing protein kinase 1-like n=1 Tax=Amphibalanus amphitrite TaxID=1232801 RepID=UPI001C8FFDE7|nr:aarF domain-containing protein kinase 1-like [Amphibalanus amphitrite]XP_043243070.1 aarF domain-containing protein kinase 1-like [Amphibalanus amphitrite]XP_043243071.1 aarF domain-containing protein kinase 1-like [Amphibalanus amphitrite]XP_043243072.1 aarF domain-containing protein kinase 1-like [Amphibalanus amphitrite]
MHRRGLLKLVATAGVAGSVYASLRANDWDLHAIGLVRFGRAAITVGQISWDYQRSLYWSGLAAGTAEYDRLKSEVHQRGADRLLRLCCANRGCFIKVGQHLGALDYLIPAEYVRTLRILHSRAPQTPLHELLALLSTELGVKASDVVAEVDPEPLGTASLAQVHRARLTDGSTVALKIQHPTVLANSFVDMKTMEVLVRLVSWVFPDFELMWLAEETKKNLPRELDFSQEAKNAERVADMFKHFAWLRVPKVRWDLTTSRVLTMEYCDGGQVNDPDYLHTHGISPREVSQKLGKLYSEMIFEKGYIHCDPHPGNLLVRKNDGGNVEIVLLDHGLYTTLPDKLRWSYSRFWLSILSGDLVSMEREGGRLGVGRLYGLLACMVAGRSWQAITTGLDKQKLTEAEEGTIKEEVSRYLPEIAAVLNKVPRELLLIFKTNDLLRGIDYSLGTKGSMTSLLTMCECCVRSVYGERYQRCESTPGRLAVLATQHWTLLKIKIYEVYLRVLHSPLGQRMAELWSGWGSVRSPLYQPAVIPEA